MTVPPYFLLLGSSDGASNRATRSLEIPKAFFHLRDSCQRPPYNSLGNSDRVFILHWPRSLSNAYENTGDLEESN